MGIICWKKRIAMGSGGLLMLVAAALASAQVQQAWLRTYNSGGNDGVITEGQYEQV